MELPYAVKLIWAIWLLIAYLCVPVVLVLLTRIARAARKIAIYADQTRESAVKITEHLEAVAGLDQTVELLTTAVGVSGDIAAGAEKLTATLAGRGYAS